MQTVVTQGFDIQAIDYSKIAEKKGKSRHINGHKTLTEDAEMLPKYVTPTINREETLESIAFLTQYMEDLKAGRPVENLSPSNDPWYLVPENIAILIESDKAMLKPDVKFRIVNPENIWEGI